MLSINTLIQILTIIFAFSGMYLVARTYRLKRRIDYTTLRARAFLNESFMTDIWTLIFLVCTFFIIHAFAELDEMFGFFIIDDTITKVMTEGTELGILACSIILAYKWFRLVDISKK